MIYAFTGKKRSGKSTASNYLQEKLNAKRVNFKDPLLIELQATFPDVFRELIKLFDQHHYDGWGWTAQRLLEEKPSVIRALLQNYGTNLRRTEQPNYWVKQWLHEIVKIDGHIVSDDVRFLNEAEAVRGTGGVIIRIIREGQVSTDTHVSETEMEQIEPDYTISVPDGDLDTLYERLDEIILWTKTA